MRGGIETIEIETVNRCNGICPFCPVNVNQPQRPYAKMTEKLFRKIVDELAEMNYKMGVSLFSNNEPFLDERIIDFHRYANEKLPEAIFWLYTNGTLLTFEKFIEIMPFLDLLIIDNYNDKKEINSPELQRIYDYIQKHHEFDERVKFWFRMQNEVLTSRGGQAPNKQGMNDRSTLNVLCILPFVQLIVRPTGEVSLCCNDALGKYTLGNLSTQSIAEVWSSEKYKSIRMDMLANGRKNLLLCKDCDFICYTSLETIRKRP
ncbi:MAG: SPASM domain-containing protein [Synergistaceae bacterium]|nr:SPASM domain-containing protein [Synergistaceae bacterium]MBQ3448910.1 SPASM domain-containing protein [Synergistaceae bacterium]MBQ3695111.1 SPASM domain-containing protein [Synergistaceae bacterium]MBQ9629674.1 SPASM domain-containing protein [Synergistaceae bacterium]